MVPVLSKTWFLIIDEIKTASEEYFGGILA
jgi:hypothetical protein